MRICTNCRSWLDDNAEYCNRCGTKLSEEGEGDSDVVSVTPVYSAASPEAANTDNTATAQPAAPYVPPTMPAPPVQPAAFPPPVMPAQKESLYFSKGALAFCLVVIALLSISTGVFAGLYFSALPV